MTDGTTDAQALWQQATYHLAEATMLFAQYGAVGSLQAPPTMGTAPAMVQVPARFAHPTGTVGSLEKWALWLKDNQPATRQQIADAVGVPLAAQANAHIIKWEKKMAHWPDGAVPADIVCSISALPEGKGRPPTIYFLWGQRFDVYPLFSVGPSERLDPLEPPVETVLGVVHPPVEEPTDPTVTDDTEPTLAWPDPVTGYETMEQWHAHWDSVLEPLALIDAKPTDEEMEEILATLPADLTDSPKTIFAVEYNKARRRAEAARDAAGLDWG